MEIGVRRYEVFAIVYVIGVLYGWLGKYKLDKVIITTINIHEYNSQTFECGALEMSYCSRTGCASGQLRPFFLKIAGFLRDLVADVRRVVDVVKVSDSDLGRRSAAVLAIDLHQLSVCDRGRLV